MMAIQEDPSPSPSREDELRKLQDKLRMLQKYGTMTDEQIDARLVQEKWKADAPERKRQMAAARLAEQARIDQETRQIARAELGKRIFASLNLTRINILNPDGGVPCPECGGGLGHATGALMTIADLLRGGGGGYDFIARLDRFTGTGIPCVHAGGSCPHCGARAEVLVQLVI